MVDLSEIPLDTKIYMSVLGNIDSAALLNTRHQVYIYNCLNSHEIINGEIKGIHYVDTIEENGVQFMLVRGDSYVPNTKAKSARK